MVEYGPTPEMGSNCREPVIGTDLKDCCLLTVSVLGLHHMTVNCLPVYLPSHQPAYLSACLLPLQPVCLPVCLYSCLPAFPPTCLPVCLPVFLPVCLFACLPPHPSLTCLSFGLSASLPFPNLSVYLSVFSPVCLPTLP